jgi:hypothetical protein
VWASGRLPAARHQPRWRAAHRSYLDGGLTAYLAAGPRPSTNLPMRMSA